MRVALGGMRVERPEAAGEVDMLARRQPLVPEHQNVVVEMRLVHPLEGGALRLKFRRDRRFGLRRENPLVFYPRYVGETLVKLWQYWSVYRECKAILDQVLAAPDRWTYTDLAITPPGADEFETLDLYHATAGGEGALARKYRDDAIRAAVKVAV